MATTESGFLLQSAGELPGPDLAAGQAYLDQAKAYEDAQRAKGYLVRQTSAPTAENAWMYAQQNIPVDQLYNLGYEFRTNADKLAKTKKNPTAQVWLNPSSTYSLVNERGQDQVVASGSDISALDSIYQTARELSTSQGKKANWKLVETLPDGTTRVMADDDPKSKLGSILDIALPLLGAALVPLTGGISGALGAAVGGAGGSALSGIAQGKSLGNIIKNAAISGGLSYLGSSALGGLGGGGSGITGGAGAGSLAGSAGADTLGNLAGQSLRDIVVQGAKGVGSSVIGGATAALGGGLGALAGPVGELVVQGAKNTAANIPGAIGAASGAVGGLSGLPQDIVVTGNPSAGVGSSIPGLVTLPAIGAAAGTAAAGGGKSTLDKVSDYLQAAGLISGTVGNLFGGGGTGSGDGTVAGLGSLRPVFGAQLPTATGNFAARQMPQQDWNTYAMRPEQSFFEYVPRRYSPGGLG